MSDFTPSIAGQANTAGDQRELFLTMFSGEVLEAFNTMRVVEGKYKKKVITEGKAYSWPEIWKAVASTHTPGAELDGQEISHGERLITVDDLNVVPIFIADIDAALAHYDSRAPYATQMGEALNNLDEKNVLRTMLLAARETTQPTNALNPGSNEKDGNIIVDADADDTQANLIAAFYTAAQTFDERNVPSGMRSAFLAPSQYYLLTSTGNDQINRDFGGQGSVNAAQLPSIAEISINKSNNLRELLGTNESADTTVNAKYRANWTNTVALFNTPDAVGKVEIIGVQSQAQWMIRNQGWFLVSRMANGLGVLRPEAAIELALA